STLKFKMPSGEEIVPAWYKEDDLQIVKEFFLLYQINLRLDPEQGTTIPFHLGTCPHPASIASSIRRQSSASIVPKNCNKSLPGDPFRATDWLAADSKSRSSSASASGPRIKLSRSSRARTVTVV